MNCSAALPAPLFERLSGLWVESEHAQFLVTAAGFRNARGPRDGLLTRGQFEHSEAAIERGCPRIAALRNRAVGRDEHRRHVLVDPAAEDVDAGRLCFLDHDVRVVAHSFPLAVGNDHRCAGKGDQVLGHGALILRRLTAAAMRVCGLTKSSQPCIASYPFVKPRLASAKLPGNDLRMPELPAISSA